MSDMGMGSFAETSKKMAEFMEHCGVGGKVFRVGEKVRVKESNFTVENIAEHTLVLRLIPDDDQQQIPRKS